MNGKYSRRSGAAISTVIFVNLRSIRSRFDYSRHCKKVCRFFQS
jgi:hypothetical protein